VVGVTNFAYVKVKNRGTQTATNVVVKAFHANPSAGLVYPNDWQPMNTAYQLDPELKGPTAYPVLIYVNRRRPECWT
jgi:zinc metalloprotease ZmpB